MQSLKNTVADTETYAWVGVALTMNPTFPRTSRFIILSRGPEVGHWQTDTVFSAAASML